MHETKNNISDPNGYFELMLATILFLYILVYENNEHLNRNTSIWYIYVESLKLMLSRKDSEIQIVIEAFC